VRDWLAHRLLTVLFERRQRGTIPKAGCETVREDVKRGDLAAAVTYLRETAAPADESVEAWLETPLREAVEGWEDEGRLSTARVDRIRDHLDAGEWAAAVELVSGDGGSSEGN
jgi:hypothetical protein